MQPLSTFDVWLNILVAAGMPLIIAANLTSRVRSDAKNAYLWREHANFMWLSMGIIGLLSVWSIVQLAGHFQLVRGEVVDAALPVIGVPFLFLAVAEIWLGGRIALQYLRAKRSAG